MKDEERSDENETVDFPRYQLRVNKAKTAPIVLWALILISYAELSQGQSSRLCPPITSASLFSQSGWTLARAFLALDTLEGCLPEITETWDAARK